MNEESRGSAASVDDSSRGFSTAFKESMQGNTAVTSSLAFLLVLLLIAVPFVFSAPAEEPTDFEWSNTTWQHRFGLNITANEDLQRWPIEREYNFTRLLRNQSNPGAFDNNSVRVYEYNSSGHLLYEIPSQFDRGDNYNKSTNAYGEVVFQLNGTTAAGESRQFFIYFDSEDHGPKDPPSYATNLSYAANGEQFTVNTTKLNYTLDTSRKNDTSGIVRVVDRDIDQFILSTDQSNRSAEYIEYTNGTHQFTFNLSRNYSFTPGPLRLTVTQRGYQTYYGQNSENKTLFVTKKYHFYSFAGESNAGFVKIEQELENRGNISVDLASNQAGALALDANRTIRGSGHIITTNNTEPYSSVLTQTGTAFAGIININESVPGYTASTSNQGLEDFRIGINLSQRTVAPGENLSQQTFFDIGREFSGGTADEFRSIRDMFKAQPTVDQFVPETINATVNASTNATVYNRNETLQIIGNMTFNPYNETKIVNATLNKNTSSTADDDTITLDFNGSDIWTGTYKLQNDSNIGEWKVNVTAYTEDFVELDTDTTTFNLTDILDANLTITNDVEIVGDPVFANLTVRNIREDRNITGADVSCDYAGSSVDPSNITEFNSNTFPGLYSINFTAPGPAGDYTLSCNATRTGNLGQDSDDFRTEVAKVNPNVSFTPQNISLGSVNLTRGENFTFVANVTNNADGTASDTNITLSLPANWTANTTFQQCGDLGPDSFCSRAIEGSVPNASRSSPGNFSVNHTLDWVNPDDTTNSSLHQLDVEVEENPVLDIFETQVNGTVGGGQERRIQNFTVQSLGNFNLTDVNATCPVGTACNDFNVSFDPSNFSTLKEGNNRTVKGNVSVPKGYQPGNYTGTINVTSTDSFDTLTIHINVLNTTTVTTNTLDSDNLVPADRVTQQDNQTISFQARVNNTGEAFAFGVNSSLSLPSGWGTNTSNETFGDMDVNQSNITRFYLTVPNSTDPGNFTLDVDTNWSNPDSTFDQSSDSLVAWIQQNPVQDVNDTFVNGTVAPASEERIGNFTVESIGNYNITNVQFTCESGTGDVCRNFTTEFDPSSITTLDDGANRTVDVNVTVPAQYPAGSYKGDLNISSDGGYNIVTANVTVPVSRSWTLDSGQSNQNECITSSDPAEGNACKPNITNTGNTDINLTITPASANSTEPDQQNFSIGLGDWNAFNMTYNVTEDPGKTYNAVYNISADQEATPQWQYLNVTVTPSVPPHIEINITPDTIQQNETTALLANVSSSTDFNITSVNATVVSPLNVSVNDSLVEIEQAPNSSLWRLYYPNATAGANTTITGNYTVNISATDALGNNASNTSQFLVTTNLQETFQTLNEFNDNPNIYRPGETGTIYYKLTDILGDGLQGADVNFSIVSSQLPSSIRVVSGDTSTFTTDQNGELDLLSFDINDDFAPGIYSIFSNTSWFDNKLSRTEELDSENIFFVNKSGDIQPDMATGSPYAPGENFTAYVATTEDNTLTNVDGLNLTVYDPNGTVFFEFNKTDFQKRDTGIYKVWKEIPSDPTLGVYTGQLSVEKDGSKTVRFESFRIDTGSGGGLFDIRAQLIENSVPQGDHLDFNLTMTKMTGEDGDAEVSYWISKDGTQYAFTSETIFTPVNETITIARNLFVFENQATGTYRLNAEVQPLEGGGTPATANATFQVTEANETSQEQEVNVVEETETRTVTPDAPSAPATNDTAPSSNLSIVDAPRVINLARGKTAYRSVTVANTGDLEMNNLSLVMVGLLPSWYQITPNSVSSISTEQSETFTLRIDAPAETEPQGLNATLLATTDAASTRKQVRINVFQSLEEKIQADITVLEQQLDRLKQEEAALEDDGADTSGIETIIQEIEARINSSTSSLQTGDTDAALQDISAANSLVNEADRNLDKLQQQAEAEESAFRLIPIIGGILVLIALVLGVIYMVKVRQFSPVSAIKDRLKGITLKIKKKQQEEKNKLKEEKQKASRLINLLEAQHEEGIMDDETYEELKTSAEQRLKRINKKLEGD